MHQARDPAWQEEGGTGCWTSLQKDQPPLAVWTGYGYKPVSSTEV